MKISFKTILRMDYFKVSSKPFFFNFGKFCFFACFSFTLQFFSFVDVMSQN